MLLTKIGFEFIFTKPIMIKWQNDKVNGLFFMTDLIAGLRHLVYLILYFVLHPTPHTSRPLLVLPPNLIAPKIRMLDLRSNFEVIHIMVVIVQL